MFVVTVLFGVNRLCVVCGDCAFCGEPAVCGVW